MTETETKPEFNIGVWFDHGLRTADDLLRAIIVTAEDFGWGGVEDEYRELVDGDGWTDSNTDDGEILIDIADDAETYLNDLLADNEPDKEEWVAYFGGEPRDCPHEYRQAPMTGNLICRHCDVVPVGPEDSEDVCLGRLVWWIGNDADRGAFGLWLDIEE